MGDSGWELQLACMRLRFIFCVVIETGHGPDPDVERRAQTDEGPKEG
jgi:hypothetical protein